MKGHAGSITRVAAFKQLVSRFAFLGLGVAAFALMMLGKADSILVERVRTGVIDVVAPVMDVISRPAAAVAEAVENVRSLAAIRAENARLRETNERLLKWQSVARQLEAENAQLKDLLSFAQGPEANFISARVIGDSGTNFVHSLLVNAGSRDGVKKGQAVLTAEGLAGRITDVGLRAARILLVTDVNSRVAVTLENSRAKAILAGDNSDFPRLIHTQNAQGIEVGDRLVTSGAGGGYPPGIPVGVVTSTADGNVRVEPFVKRHKLEYARIVDYGLSGILPPIEPQKAPAREARSGGSER